MAGFTIHATDGNAANELGASFNWDVAGSFNYDEMSSTLLTLIRSDNDTEITNINYEVQQPKSYNRIIVNNNASNGGLSYSSSFTAERMLRPSIAIADLIFSENLVDLVAYTLSRFVPSGATP